MESKTQPRKKYIYKFLKFVALATIACLLPGIMSLCLMIIEGEYTSVAILLFLPLIIAIIVSPLYIIRFNRLISNQEKMFNIKFEDNNAKELGNPIAFISDNWLIHSGTCAFYREYVKSFSVKKEWGATEVTSYKIIVNTIDGKKYSFYAGASKDIVMCREWLHRKKAK